MIQLTFAVKCGKIRLWQIELIVFRDQQLADIPNNYATRNFATE